MKKDLSRYINKPCYLTVVGVRKLLGRNLYAVSYREYPENILGEYTTKEIKRFGDVVFDNISISGNQVYFVDSKYLKKVKEKQDENEVLRTQKILKQNEKKAAFFKSNYKKMITSTPTTLEERIQNYINSVHNHYGYLNPNIKISVYNMQEMESWYKEETADGTYYFVDFYNNVEAMLNRYKNQDIDAAYLVKDLIDFNYDYYERMGRPSSQEVEDFSNEELKDICEKIVIGLSKLTKVYSSIYINKDELLWFKNQEYIVCLDEFLILSIGEEIKIPFCSDINYIGCTFFKAANLNPYSDVFVKMGNTNLKKRDILYLKEITKSKKYSYNFLFQ